MTGEQLRLGREQKGWNQVEAAARLGVSQPYLSLLEKGVRRVPEKLARKVARRYHLSPSALPVETDWESLKPARSDVLAVALASLGYPGFAYLKHSHKKNPAEVLLRALLSDDLESRLIEALPWVVWQYADMDWRWLVNAAKMHDLQNRLGFVTNVARLLAERAGEREKASRLQRQESALYQSMLAREGTLCRDSLTEVERRWLKTHRPVEAKRWRLLTDLSPDHLHYAT